MTDFIYLKITKRSEKGLFSLLIESKNYLFESFKLFLLKNQKKKIARKTIFKKIKIDLMCLKNYSCKCKL